MLALITGPFGAVALLVALAVTIFFSGYRAGNDAAEKAALAEKAAALDTAHTKYVTALDTLSDISAELLKTKTALSAKQQIIKTEADNDIHANLTAYTNCVLDTDGLRLWNGTAGSDPNNTSNTAVAPAGMPSAGTPKRP